LHRSCAQALSVPPWEFRQRLVWVRVLAVLHPSGIGSLGQHAITLGNQKELNLTIRILARLAAAWACSDNCHYNNGV